VPGACNEIFFTISGRLLYEVIISWIGRNKQYNATLVDHVTQYIQSTLKKYKRQNYVSLELLVGIHLYYGNIRLGNQNKNQKLR